MAASVWQQRSQQNNLNVFLTKNSDYAKCYNQGLKTHTQYFILFFLKTNGPARFGITVSKKVGGAVVRNRIKRLLRTFIRNNYKSNISYDVVILAKKNSIDFVKKKYSVLELDLVRHINNE